MITPTHQVNEKTQILLVDDEEAVRDLLLRMLETGGYEVSSASCGPAALEACRRCVLPPRLLVTDIQMPVMSGYELADRCSLLYPSIGILFVSGSVPDDSTRAALHGPHREFLAKPVRLEDLLRAVKTLLDRPAEDRLPRRRVPSRETDRTIQSDYLQA